MWKTLTVLLLVALSGAQDFFDACNPGFLPSLETEEKGRRCKEIREDIKRRSDYYGWTHGTE